MLSAIFKTCIVFLFLVLCFGCQNEYEKSDFLGTWEGDVWGEYTPGVRINDSREKHEIVFLPNDSFIYTVFHTERKCRLGEINPLNGKWFIRDGVMYISKKELTKEEWCTYAANIHYLTKDSMYFTIHPTEGISHFTLKKSELTN